MITVLTATSAMCCNSTLGDIIRPAWLAARTCLLLCCFFPSSVLQTDNAAMPIPASHCPRGSENRSIKANWQRSAPLPHLKAYESWQAGKGWGNPMCHPRLSPLVVGSAELRMSMDAAYSPPCSSFSETRLKQTFLHA